MKNLNFLLLVWDKHKKRKKKTSLYFFSKTQYVCELMRSYVKCAIFVNSYNNQTKIYVEACQAGQKELY